MKRILEAAGRPDLEPEYLPARQGDADHVWGDNTQAKDLLGWEPKVPLQRGLAEFVVWYKKFRDPINQIGPALF